MLESKYYGIILFLRVENKPVYYRNQGINKISDLLDDSGRFLDYNRFCQMYLTSGIKWLDFNGIISAAKCSLKQYAPRQECSQVKTLSPTDFSLAKKPSGLVYTMFININAVSPVKSQQKWKNNLCREEQVAEINWKSAFTISYNCTKSTKLRCFHFKFLNRRIATNGFLYKGDTS